MRPVTGALRRLAPSLHSARASARARSGLSWQVSFDRGYFERLTHRGVLPFNLKDARAASVSRYIGKGLAVEVGCGAEPALSRRPNTVFVDISEAAFAQKTRGLNVVGSIEALPLLAEVANA